MTAFADVSSAAELEAVLDLEGWTDDRVVKQRLGRLPVGQWAYGVPNASVIMASFLHTAPSGLRFSSGDLGAWYASLSLKTAIAEVSHHLRREAFNTGRTEMRGQYTSYTARLDGRYLDIRGAAKTHPELYRKSSYAASQLFGERIRRSDFGGLVYDSLRHAKGTNLACFHPRMVRDVTEADRLDITVPGSGRVVVRTLRL